MWTAVYITTASVIVVVAYLYWKINRPISLTVAAKYEDL